MTVKLLSFLFSFSLLAGVTSSAANLKEDFESEFPAWESGWLGINSNLRNFNGVGLGRGNNPDGLWIDDGLVLPTETKITFNSTFGSSLTSLSLDVATFVSVLVDRSDIGEGFSDVRPLLTLEIFDIAGSALLTSLVTPTFGALTEPGVYASFSAQSSNGIGGFRFSAPRVDPTIPFNGRPVLGFIDSIEGNTSIDNVVATTKTTVQVPDTASTSLLVGLGLLTLAACRRRYRR